MTAEVSEAMLKASEKLVKNYLQNSLSSLNLKLSPRQLT